ncbi:FkbM family methyltransferase [Candidatus Omnitrophota bacterium]
MREDIMRLDYAPHEIWISAESHVEKESRAFSCKKEPDTVSWIEKYIKSGDTALDIGANVGAYSLIMAKVMGDKGKVYAFEPAWQNFQKLNKNIILNKCQDRMVALNIALSDEKKIDIFNYRDLTYGSSLHTVGEAVDFVGKEFEPAMRQEIMCYTVDGFVKEFGIGEVNHIKLDVDGIEAKVIKGAQGLLRSSACRSMMVELNEDFEADRECLDLIKSCGFKVVSKSPNPSAFYESDTIFNYIFVKE